VVLTHKHPDHAGGLPSVQPEAPNATAYIGQADLAAITVPAGTSLSALADGEEVFGLRVVATPGHTAGHLSVFDPTTGVLVAGDALRTTNGLQSSDPKYTEDPAAATASVKKLAALDVRVILPGHGEPLTSGASDALKKLAASLATA
jgi:glyoxylase-like metal-dependent hydrolase (beta-lactamase superfamily II)